jgi:hypothetical protein
MRESGVRGVLVYCSDYRCCRCVTASADPWPVGTDSMTLVAVVDR